MPHRHFPRRGLTLIELVVVIAIILLLALAVFWVASKVRALVVALDPEGVRRIEGRGEKPPDKPDDKPSDKHDQPTPGDKKETPPK
ncbi:MAG: prepilin-type N-terminal cleavage/methylation domain-containing protein [Phycisphaerales bacterium]|nr:prepilin-type N-terminal cleavage/methylation domain-containing protein [Phycisphaerales bacterium]